MATKADCQPNVSASHTVMGDAMMPKAVPELKRPVASARSC